MTPTQSHKVIWSHWSRIRHFPNRGSVLCLVSRLARVRWHAALSQLKQGNAYHEVTILIIFNLSNSSHSPSSVICIFNFLLVFSLVLCLNKGFLERPSAKKAGKFLNLSRNWLRIMTRLLTGHCHLKKLVFKVGLVSSPECDRCR